MKSLVAWRGDLCFGPSQGQNVTFVHPRKWINAWRPAEPYAALTLSRYYQRPTSLRYTGHKVGFPPS
jgi:hypothetical protein